MGGIKNRDEKRKKNHVFASGGGGGTKGPAVLDKRGQEQKCPHCDKIFKQSGRLKEHIAAKHADVAAADTATDSPQQPPQQQPQPPQPKMMDVGAAAGYYTQKSPKMLLHEWCIKEKRLKPRYRAIPQSGSNTTGAPYGCKVVLPDGKESERDVVVFLPNDMHADDEDEACQRAAVVMLHRVAAQRAFDRILPRQFVWVWERCAEVEAQRAQRAAAARQAAEKRAAAERQRRLTERLKAPKAVVMSEDKQRMVENLLKSSASSSALYTSDDVLTTNTEGSDAAHPDEQDNGSEGDLSVLLDIAQHLNDMGFDESDVWNALHETKAAKSSDQPRVLDWLCRNLPPENVPDAFRDRRPASRLQNGVHAPAAAQQLLPETDDVAAAAAATLQHAGVDAAADSRRICNGILKPAEQPKPTVDDELLTTSLSQEKRVAESRRLLTALQTWRSCREGAAMQAQRSKLPAHAHRDGVIDAVRARRVVVICGATGCGKSTQAPQYVLESATERGTAAECSIVVTQPRRLPCVALASRVADERGERVGDVVGYSVRLDSKRSSATRLLFCTTGVLLRQLVQDTSLRRVTHVIVDEVHERSVESDLLLLLLRDVLKVRKDLKIILMSATADADAFASYFSECSPQIVDIPGFTYPVRVLYLEDAVAMSDYTVARGSRWAKSPAEQKAATSVPPGHAIAEPSDWAPLQPIDEDVRSTVAKLDESKVNVDLIEHVLAAVLRSEAQHGPQALLDGWQHAQHAYNKDSGASAVLVFLPGADDISKCMKVLSSSQKLAAAAGSSKKLMLLPLHGSLPPSQQSRVFNRPPAGVRKVILSTNVAETSVTIEDVTLVIDACLHKQPQYDASRGIARLATCLVSRAAAQQRRGRAGRVRPGVCIRLLSTRTFQSLSEHESPEICRTPLESLCLNIKAIIPNHPLQTVLSKALTPPPSESINRAIATLQYIQALDADEALTSLGRHLTRMPMDARVAKMLIFGTLLQCTSAMLTIAASMAHGRGAFMAPPDKRNEATAAKQQLLAPVVVSKSDHIAVVMAYNTWLRQRAQHGPAAATRWCTANFVSEQTMEAIRAGRQDYVETLFDLGFVSREYREHVRTQGRANANDDGASTSLSSSFDEDACGDNARFVKAAVCAGFYPQLLRVEEKQKFVQVHSGAVQTEGDARETRFYERHKGRVFIHPSSINFSQSTFESGWMVYTEMVETSKVFVRECSMVPVYAVLLFGGDLVYNQKKGVIEVDGWATFKATNRIATLVRGLRNELQALLQTKIATPSMQTYSHAATQAMRQLLAVDGF